MNKQITLIRVYNPNLDEVFNLSFDNLNNTYIFYNVFLNNTTEEDELYNDIDKNKIVATKDEMLKVINDYKLDGKFYDIYKKIFVNSVIELLNKIN